ncbi:hypothetical protein M885DRAFT_604847, partial [Pelagophyceae sp. CCMP2097]
VETRRPEQQPACAHRRADSAGAPRPLQRRRLRRPHLRHLRNELKSPTLSLEKGDSAKRARGHLTGRGRPAQFRRTRKLRHRRHGRRRRDAPEQDHGHRGALGGLRHHSPPPGQDAPRAGHHDENDHGPRRVVRRPRLQGRGAALRQDHLPRPAMGRRPDLRAAPRQRAAPRRPPNPQTLLLSPNLQIPVDALVCVLTSSRDHYEPLVKRP